MELKKFWNLTFYLAKSGFRIRNEGSFLGVFWYLLNPILFFAMLFLIFSNNLGSGVKYYPLYLFLGLIIFNFFTASTGESISVIKGNRNLLKSVNLPRMSFISGGVLKFVYSNIFEFIVFMIFMLILKVSLLNALFYPLIMIFFVIFVFGLSLIIASISVYSIDFGNLWSFFCTLLWFATPIFYTLNTHPILARLSYFNPIYYYMTAARDLIIYNQMPSTVILAGVLGFAVLFFIMGIIIFNKLKDRFTELI
ncbi:MAG TPA: ABC transporter permease [Patescibacteria group bacterium]|nr:ABC transporter permease [Patescibacteria group bacterium]